MQLIIVSSALVAQFHIQKDSVPVTGKFQFRKFNSSLPGNNTQQGFAFGLTPGYMPVVIPDKRFTSNMPVIVTDKRFTSNMPVYNPYSAFAQANPFVVIGKPILIIPQKKQQNPLTKPSPRETLRFETPLGTKGIYIF